MLLESVVFCGICFLLANFSIYKRGKDFRSLFWIVSFISLVIISGARSIDWPDTSAYKDAFDLIPSNFVELLTHTSYTLNKLTFGYGEFGFVFLTGLVKSIWQDWLFFSIIISTLTLYCLFKFLFNYNLYPIIGLFVYLSRFMIMRNMVQIRAALAISIFLFSIKYAYERRLLPYLVIVVIAASFHATLLLFIPFYWLANKVLSVKTIIVVIIGSVIFAMLSKMILSDSMRSLIEQVGVGASYLGGTEKYSSGLGLLNPMIYYQCFVLTTFIALKRKLAHKIKYYNVIKNGYLLSTLLLIGLSPFLVLSGRLSTVLATLEICIIPSFLFATSQSYKELTLIAISGVFAVFFYLNLSKLQFTI